MRFNTLTAQFIMKQDFGTEWYRIIQNKKRKLDFQKFRKTNFTEVKIKFLMAEIQKNFHISCGKIVSKQKKCTEELRKI